MIGTYDSPIPRRSFLIGSALAGASLALPDLAGAAVGYSQGFDDAALKLDDPVENLRLYVKIAGDLSGRPYVGWYAGQVFAIEQGMLTTPLFGVQGFGHGWMKRTPDGKYRNAWKEVGYYTDLATNEIIDTWRNPFNSERCEVMHIHNRSVNMTLAPHFPDFERFVPAVTGPTAAPPSGDDPTKPFILRWFTHRDTVAVSLDSRFTGPNPLDPQQWPRESTGKRVSISEFFMQIADRREVLDPHRTSTHNVGQWTRLCPWLPWMLMGPAPGQLLYRAMTKKVAGLEQIPAPIIAYTEKHYPELLKISTDEDFKMPPESSWEVFKNERRPAPPKS